MTTEDQPISQVLWVPRTALRANEYNPNIVAPPELRLLELSILEDGWTQPIVARKNKGGKTYEIVDGFHRWTVSEKPKVSELTDGCVPVVITRNTTDEERRLSTVRHNRARGQHHVIRMAEIVADLLDKGIAPEELERRLGMEDEEVERLAQRGKMTDRAAGGEFGEAWSPAAAERADTP